MSGNVGDLLYQTPQILTTNGVGENANVSIVSSVLLVTPGASGDSISGLVPPQTYDGLEARIINVHATFTLVLAGTTNSMAGFRIVLPPGKTTLTLAGGEAAALVFTQGIGWRPLKTGTFA